MNTREIRQHLMDAYYEHDCTASPEDGCRGCESFSIAMRELDLIDLQMYEKRAKEVNY